MKLLASLLEAKPEKVIKLKVDERPTIFIDDDQAADDPDIGRYIKNGAFFVPESGPLVIYKMYPAEGNTAMIYNKVGFFGIVSRKIFLNRKDRPPQSILKMYEVKPHESGFGEQDIGDDTEHWHAAGVRALKERVDWFRKRYS